MLRPIRAEGEANEDSGITRTQDLADVVVGDVQQAVALFAWRLSALFH